MSLTGVTRRLTDSEAAREPRSLAVVAWFDGWSRGGNPSAPRLSYPRRLTPDEAQAWREGYREAAREVARHRAHGFLPCDPDCDHSAAGVAKVRAALTHQEQA